MERATREAHAEARAALHDYKPRFEKVRAWTLLAAE
jgi:hypothetical protein